MESTKEERKLNRKIIECVSIHFTYVFRVNLDSVIASMSRNSFLKTGIII